MALWLRDIRICSRDILAAGVDGQVPSRVRGIRIDGWWGHVPHRWLLGHRFGSVPYGFGTIVPDGGCDGTVSAILILVSFGFTAFLGF